MLKGVEHHCRCWRVLLEWQDRGRREVGRSLAQMARREGFEPPTVRVEAGYSIQLS